MIKKMRRMGQACTPYKKSKKSSNFPLKTRPWRSADHIHNSLDF